MNSNQVKGSVKEVAGKVQKNVGNAVGSTSQEAKGMAREVAGKAQKAVGDVQERVEERAEDRIDDTNTTRRP